MQTLLLVLFITFLVTLLLHLRAMGKFERNVRTAMQYVRFSNGPDNDEGVNRAALPEIVRAFAAKSGVPDTGGAISASFHQLAEMRMNPGDEWMNLRAEQMMGTEKIGFVWYAAQKRAGLTTMRVMDAYVGGDGMLSIRLLGSIPLADMRGVVTDQAELMRYLAELPWAPDAILYNPHLRWRQVEENIVEVEAGEGATLARVQFHFDAAGDVVEMHADERGRSEGFQIVKRPWRGYYSAYKTIEGEFAGATGFRRIPTKAEVGWILDAGYFAYWRGQIATYALEYAQPRPR
jgi:hypothetical protein